MSRLSLFLPLHPPPKCRFPLYCSGSLFRGAPQHHVLWGLSRPGFPAAWSCFSPGLSLLAALGLGHEPCCLVSRPQPPWWDDPAGDVSKTRLCGKSDSLWFGPHFPGWGPACSFSPPQAGEAAALASLPTDTAAGLTSASPCTHEVFCGYASPGSSQGSCGSLLTPDQ